MKNILVYEDGSINEYEILYDQEYMNALIHEYKKNFSLLRKGKICCPRNFEQDELRKMLGCIDDIISLSISGCEDDDCFCIKYVGAINPTVYNILTSNQEFTIDNKRIHSLYAWYQAIKDNDCESRDLSLSGFDYHNIDEKMELHFNISSLLSEISLEYVGTVDTDKDIDLIRANRNALFIKEFGVNKNSVKKMKK